MSQKRQYFLAIPFFFKKKQALYLSIHWDLIFFSLSNTRSSLLSELSLKIPLLATAPVTLRFLSGSRVSSDIFQNSPYYLHVVCFCRCLVCSMVYSQCRFLFPTVEGSDFFPCFCSFLTLWWLTGLHVCCKSFYELKKDSIFQPNSVQPSFLDTDKT